MIRRAAFALLATLSLGVAAGPAHSQRQMMPSVGVGTANPSAIVAAELGMARQAREEGQWTALRKLADKDAVIFAPGPLNAQAWLKQQTDPARPVRWNPQQIFIACDGSYAAATGSLERVNGQAARFVTLWRQQRKGDYKWVMTATSDTPWSGEADGMIKASVADCARRGERPERRDRDRDIVRLPDPPPASGSAQSEDGSLRWTWTVSGDARTLEVFLRRGAGEERAIQETVAEGPR
ncbi:hypothetical protein [Sphingobium sp. B12D2B]|uniref:hypothetical protein n=1 Tax=Sphingobium sp. B12D2B TaxID=2940577 RepID=UPI0022247BEE|nr:hypothetical protein [Sphingobium sp. B12D2B]MCW2351455.1 hypothetical protein [Sphingobium sp. B12D2B]